MNTRRSFFKQLALLCAAPQVFLPKEPVHWKRTNHVLVPNPDYFDPRCYDGEWQFILGPQVGPPRGHVRKWVILDEGTLIPDTDIEKSTALVHGVRLSVTRRKWVRSTVFMKD